MRARPEPTQLERLSDATFLGKLLLLPASVRLDWKVIGRYKHSAYLASSSATPGVNVINHFSFVTDDEA